MSRILVTGGYGYVGGHLVNALALSHDVVVLDNMLSSKDWSFPANVAHHRASISNPDAVARAMQGVDIVYHLADRMVYNEELARDKNCIMRTIKANAYGTSVVLSCARSAGVDNVIVASSYAVYGSMTNASEVGPVLPCGVYGCSKLSMEGVCAAFHSIGMNVKVLRLYEVWGLQHSLSTVDDFINGGGGICGDGTQTRDFVHISDVINALIDARMWDTFLYNVGTGVEISMRGLWELINPSSEPAVGDCHCASMTDGIVNACADMSDTFARVKWRPSINLADLTITDFERTGRRDGD